MKIIFRIFQEISNLRYEIRSRFSFLPNTVDYDVPYVCQFAKPEHAELSLKKELNPVDDLHWKDTGAKSPERYAQWAFTMCGMASTAMAVEYFKGKKLSLVELAEDALQSGVYTEGEKEISSMKYREFTKWVRKHSLSAQMFTRLSIRGIQYALSLGSVVMVSVNPNIRGFDTAPFSQKGGHLVLVTGYDVTNQIILLNNPSGFVSTKTQIKHRLSIPDFLKYYAGRGIVISK